MINSKLFIEKEIPKLHPASREYLDYWKTQKQRCIEGYWAAGKWMPPNLYFYINFGTILVNKTKNSKNKIPSRPSLWDIHWDFFWSWSVCRGLTGFDKQPEVKALIAFLGSDEKDNWEKEAEIRASIPDIRKVLRESTKDLGKPIYLNEAKNLMMLGSRDYGKSFSAGNGIIAHEFLFDGIKEYNEEVIKNPPSVEILVGAGDTKYSADLLKKTKLCIDSLPGSIEINGIFYPSPFFKRITGSYNKEIVHLYKKKIGGSWVEKGSKSIIRHRTFSDNPFAAQGTRNSVMVLEECFGKGTKVLMNDLSTKNIEDLSPDDLLMGVDGLPKSIKRLWKGNTKLYNIIQKKGISYVTTGSHKLYLEQRSGKEYKDDGIKLISVNDFLTLKSYKKRTTYGKKNKLLPFKKQNVLIDPYWLGLWLGDGYKKTTSICTEDEPIKNYIINHASSINMIYSIGDIKNKKAQNISILKTEGKTNPLIDTLRALNLFNNKHVPKQYLFNNEDVRLKLLAGIIDTDGYLGSNVRGKGEYYEICLCKTLAKDVILLSRSLGFNTRFKEYGSYLRIFLRGDLYKIPVLLDRKKSKQRRIQTILTSPIKIEEKGYGEYYGIELNASCDNDKLFMLEDFTIVHNCGMFENLKAAHESSVDTMKDAGYKFGSALLMGTGGDMGAGTIDSAEMFYDPTTFEMLDFEDAWEGKGKICYFVPDYLANRHFKNLNGDSDIDRAKESELNIREKIRKGKSAASAYDAHIQYHPIIPSEMFLTKSGNIFPKKELQNWLSILDSNPKYENADDIGYLLQDDKGKVIWKPDLKKEINILNKFPHDPFKDDINGGIVVWEHPHIDENGEVPYGLYLAGTDPYDHDESGTPSLGSTFIYKRFINNEEWYDTIVAEYTGRPKADDYYKNLTLLLGYYNARCLYENEKKGVHQYMEIHGYDYLLMDQPNYIRDVVPNSTVQRGKGMHMSEPLKTHGEILIKNWLESEFAPGQMNLSKIRSKPLLKELIMYNRKQGNFDRAMAFMVLMYAIQEKHKLTIKSAELDGKKNFYNTDFFNKPVFARRNKYITI